MWKAIHEKIPSRLHLVKRGIKIDSYCPRCNSFPEHSFHVLWQCAWAKETWSETALWPLLSRFLGTSYMDLWNWVVMFGQAKDCDTIGKWHGFLEYVA